MSRRTGALTSEAQARGAVVRRGAWENEGRPTCRHRGDRDEESTLGAMFFAYKNKKATLLKRRERVGQSLQAEVAGP